MHYLIDGHNLIGKLPDVSLSDPDDEVKLILKLRSWTAASSRRRVTVYFDGGIPGGKKVNLSNTQVKVIFASQGKTADSLIVRRINRVKNPPEYRLVSSDQQIIRAANGRKMKHIRSEKFAQRLSTDRAERQQPRPAAAEDQPVLSDDEVNEWLELFGPVDEKALRKRAKPIPPNRQPPEPEAEPEEAEEETAVPSLPTPADRENPELSDAELRQWLALFGGEPESPPETQETSNKKRTASPKRKKRKKAPNPHDISDEDLAAWNAYFGQDE